VCPWNRKPTRDASHITPNNQPQASVDQQSAELEPTELEPESQRFEHIELTALFKINDEQFRQRFRKTPLWRARRRGVLRNAAIVLGNQMQTDSIPALTRGLVDTEPLVRGASAWALGKIGGAAATLALEMQLKREHDPVVTSELDDALSILKR
jgi:hypothetical protein